MKTYASCLFFSEGSVKSQYNEVPEYLYPSYINLKYTCTYAKRSVLGTYKCTCRKNDCMFKETYDKHGEIVMQADVRKG